MTNPPQDSHSGPARLKAHALRAVESTPDPGATPGHRDEAAPETGRETVPETDLETADPLTLRRRRRQARLARRAEEAGAQEATPLHPGPADTGVPEPDVPPAAVRLRHLFAIASFLLVVILPFILTLGYLYTRAADQYHSEVAFSIRSEDTASAAAGILGALTQIGSGSASDTDILFEFIQSQTIVEAVDTDLDLRALYNRAEGDPIFTLGDDPTIEALTAHWRRMVEISYDASTGIIHVRANAFDPADATAIAAAILAQSDALVNRLSDQAQEDAIRYAREDFAEAEDNLRAMRQRLSAFRRENRIVDPSADVAGQMGLLNALQGELAQALVERDMLLSFVGAEDQRVIQVNRRIDAVTGRIEAERASLGVAATGEALPDVVGRYEELLVDLEFANNAYLQTLSGLTAARAEARRQSRYLAPHVAPTRAESALYPRRILLAGLAGLFLMLGWATLMLVYYNMRDNR
jgi:capsular polysaccharide transport system permease protein